MFSGIGIWEVVVIIVVVLVVLGPQRVPEIARKLGQAVRYLKRASSDLTTAVTREMEDTQDKPAAQPPKTTRPTSTPKEPRATTPNDTPGGTTAAR